MKFLITTFLVLITTHFFAQELTFSQEPIPDIGSGDYVLLVRTYEEGEEVFMDSEWMHKLDNTTMNYYNSKVVERIRETYPDKVEFMTSQEITKTEGSEVKYRYVFQIYTVLPNVVLAGVHDRETGLTHVRPDVKLNARFPANGSWKKKLLKDVENVVKCYKGEN